MKSNQSVWEQVGQYVDFSAGATTSTGTGKKDAKKDGKMTHTKNNSSNSQNNLYKTGASGNTSGATTSSTGSKTADNQTVAVVKRDTSRMKSLLLQLKNDPKAPTATAVA